MSKDRSVCNLGGEVTRVPHSTIEDCNRWVAVKPASNMAISLCPLDRDEVAGVLFFVLPTCRTHDGVPGKVSLCYGLHCKSALNVTLQIQHKHQCFGSETVGALHGQGLRASRKM